MSFSSYTKIFIIFQFCVILGLFLMTYSALHLDMLGFGNARLVKYQIDKIKNENTIEMAIVGDSSGGNAIDSDLFEKLLDKKTISLSLTGGFGYAGSYSMIKKAINKGAKTILIIQSVDMLTRDFRNSDNAIIFLEKPSILEMDDMSLLLNYKMIFSALKGWIKFIIGYDTYDINDLAKYDYIPQLANYKEKKYTNLESFSFENEKLYYLDKIVNFCNDKKVNCIYDYGPIHKSFCMNNREYIKKSTQFILKTGIKTMGLENIYCMQDQETGDSIEHVDYKYKSKITKFYARKLSKFFDNNH